MTNEEKFNETEQEQQPQAADDSLATSPDLAADADMPAEPEQLPASDAADLLPDEDISQPASSEDADGAGPQDEAEQQTTARENPLAAVRNSDNEDDDRAWYVVHCYSGYENKVRYNLEQRIETMGMKDMIFDVVIPTQEEIEVREGKRRSIERHVFPGYILVNMILTDESWFVVRNTPGVTGFVGMGTEPTALRPEEVSQILKRMEADAPHMKVTFRSGERVRIVDGPFNDFRGTVADIDMDRAKVTVMVNFFGRETPVELDFLQVEKA